MAYQPVKITLNAGGNKRYAAFLTTSVTEDDRYHPTRTIRSDAFVYPHHLQLMITLRYPIFARVLRGRFSTVQLHSSSRHHAPLGQSLECLTSEYEIQCRLYYNLPIKNTSLSL